MIGPFLAFFTFLLHQLLPKKNKILGKRSILLLQQSGTGGNSMYEKHG